MLPYVSSFVVVHPNSFMYLMPTFYHTAMWVSRGCMLQCFVMSEQTYIQMTSLLYELVRVLADDPEPTAMNETILAIIEGANDRIDAVTAKVFYE